VSMAVFNEVEIFWSIRGWIIQEPEGSLVHVESMMTEMDVKIPDLTLKMQNLDLCFYYYSAVDISYIKPGRSMTPLR